jgi:hypothetical protein
MISMSWCPGRESNPYGRCQPRDFKSLVSTNFTTQAKACLIVSPCKLRGEPVSTKRIAKIRSPLRRRLHELTNPRQSCVFPPRHEKCGSFMVPLCRNRRLPAWETRPTTPTPDKHFSITATRACSALEAICAQDCSRNQCRNQDPHPLCCWRFLA